MIYKNIEYTGKLIPGDKLQDKKCDVCGKDHGFLPENARAQTSFLGRVVDGWFFECSCGSTMFVRAKQELPSGAF